MFVFLFFFLIAKYQQVVEAVAQKAKNPPAGGLIVKEELARVGWGAYSGRKITQLKRGKGG